MVDQKKDVHNHLEQYCRMLGHRVPFEYCRSMNSNLPCSNILDCWNNIIPIDEFVHQHYSKDEIASFLRPVKPKLVQIYESMIKVAKKAPKK